MAVSGIRASRLGLIAAVLLGLSLGACGGGPQPLPASSGSFSNSASNAAATTRQAYTLGGGDELRVIVFGEEDLSGEFVIDGDGFVSLPLIGEVEAGGLTLREFEGAVEEALAGGYLREPRVSAEVLNYRPFYIIGEVQEGGEYPYTQGMSVLNAVAVAGGYSYRADRGRVFITHEGSGGEVEYRATQGVRVLPGDIIRVPERFF